MTELFSYIFFILNIHKHKRDEADKLLRIQLHTRQKDYAPKKKTLKQNEGINTFFTVLSSHKSIRLKHIYKKKFIKFTHHLTRLNLRK